MMSPESFHRQTSLMSPPSAGSMLVKLTPVAASQTLTILLSELRILVPAAAARQLLTYVIRRPYATISRRTSLATYPELLHAALQHFGVLCWATPVSHMPQLTVPSGPASAAL